MVHIEGDLDDILDFIDNFCNLDGADGLYEGLKENYGTER